MVSKTPVVRGSQADRLDSVPAGGFNTPLAAAVARPHAASEYGQVAQLVEQRIENPRVGGSIPPLATIQNQLLTLFCRSR